MIDELNKYWGGHLDGCEALAHELKNTFNERWVRFHALPDSKRYPSTENEYQEIFSRHNSVLNELNRSADDLLVILPEYKESKIPGKLESELEKVFPVYEYWRTLDQFEECGVYWHLHVARVSSGSGKLNKLFRLVANDEVANILIVVLAGNSVYHPYDGGADIILPSIKIRDELKLKIVQWLSKHPEGY
ncbi:hypothetical protein A9Q99_24345 [Gammaproteobacteria bacterium 45_16_T64]|nr:hypothetical protein A9Q99_24345 [Gammaproteobacteria bacterium 45_16_T64]